MTLLDYLLPVITVVICLFARPIGRRLGVIDDPDGTRKTHPGPTPLIGGIAVVVPLVLWAAAGITWGRASAPGFQLAILLCGSGVAILGFMDDQQGISAWGRLLLLGIFSVVALRLDTTLAIDRVHFAPGYWVSTPAYLLPCLSIVALAGFSSAVNMTDGLNGLVLALVCIWSVCLAILGGSEVSAAASVIGAASFITMLFNLRGKLFLGDCGAFALAFVIGLLAIRSHSSGRLLIETALVWFYVPVLDCLRVIVLRLLRGRSPFLPDREHFHHRLADRLGEGWATAVYAGLVGSASLLATLAPQRAVLALSILSVAFCGFLLADGLATRSASTLPGSPAGADVFALDKGLAKSNLQLLPSDGVK